jgi:pilus assembly protein Flp/PilA
MPSGVALDAISTRRYPVRGKIMTRFLSVFVADESGATAIEYALIASLIAVFIIGSLQVLGTHLSSEFNEVSNALS